MNETKKYKIGVVGVGVWGCHSLERELLNTGRCVVAKVHASNAFGAGVHDDPVAAGKAYADELNAEFAETPDEVLEDSGIDIVSVMTASKYKADLIIRAFRAGKHVVTDKPLAFTVKEAEAVVDAEQTGSARGFMLCGYHTRPAVAKLAELVVAGKLGEVKSVSVRLNFTGGVYPGFNPTKRWRSEIPGGESVTIGSHALMTAMKLVGASISASRKIIKNDFHKEYAEVGADDHAMFNLEFANGAVGNAVVGRLPYCVPNEDIVVELTGTEGYAEINGTMLKVYPDGLQFDGSFSPSELQKEVFSRFLDSLEDSTIEPPTTFQDGLSLQKALVGIAMNNS